MAAAKGPAGGEPGRAFGDRSTTRYQPTGFKPIAALSQGALAAAGEGVRFGRLTVLGFADATAKRAEVRRSCGMQLEVSVEALQAGECRSCGGCTGGPRGPARRAAGFARDVAGAETVTGRGLHRGRL